MFISISPPCKGLLKHKIIKIWKHSFVKYDSINKGCLLQRLSQWYCYSDLRERYVCWLWRLIWELDARDSNKVHWYCYQTVRPSWTFVLILLFIFSIGHSNTRFRLLIKYVKEQSCGHRVILYIPGSTINLSIILSIVLLGISCGQKFPALAGYSLKHFSHLFTILLFLFFAI